MAESWLQRRMRPSMCQTLGISSEALFWPDLVCCIPSLRMGTDSSRQAK
jgi:hypothetical protein